MNTELVKTGINDAIKDLFYQKFEIPPEKYYEIDMDAHLMGKKYRFNHRHFLYILFYIEDYFEIEIPDSYISGGRFVSLNNIIDIVYEQLEIKNRKKDQVDEE